MRPVKVIYIKKLILPVLSIIFILGLVIFSETASTSAAKGINLWLTVVFPSLFPFFVASGILNKSGFIKSFGRLFESIMRPLFNVPGCGSFAFIMGITSGYPMGAIITTDLREQNLLTKVESERLIAFTNNSGPLFIMSAVSLAMFKMPELGLLLFTCHILACITTGIVFRFHTIKGKEFQGSSKSKPKEPQQNIGEMFGDAVKNSITTILNIGGFIIFFSVIISLLIKVGLISSIAGILYTFLSPFGISRGIIEATTSGFFEITTGVNMASQAIDAPLIQKLIATSLIIGWAGLSVHSQVLSIIAKTDISIKPYLLGKLLQGIFSAFYTFIAIKIYDPLFIKAKSAFSTLSATRSLHWHEYLLSSCLNLLLVLGFLTVILIVSATIRIVRRPSR